MLKLCENQECGKPVIITIYTKGIKRFCCKKCKTLVKKKRYRQWNNKGKEIYKRKSRLKLNAQARAKKVLDRKLCEYPNCDDIGERHHHNYKKPLDVINLCSQHHREIHSWDAISPY